MIAIYFLLFIVSAWTLLCLSMAVRMKMDEPDAGSAFVLFFQAWFCWLRLFFPSPPPKHASRFRHAWHAFIHCYWWMKCPMCQKPHGGHEQHGFLPMLDQPGCGQSVCWRCAESKREELSDKMQEAHTIWSKP